MRFNGRVLDMIMLYSASALLLFTLGVWGVSIWIDDASIADIAWGLGCALVACVACGAGDGSTERRVLLALLVSIWGVRLTVFLLARRLTERREDPRYTALRKRYGSHFPLVSLGLVFLLQGALMWTILLPVQGAAAHATALSQSDGLGIAVWAVGFLFEAIGDEQLRRFRRHPQNSRQILDRGLWRYTRHPNYFGDLMMWWGIYLIALSSGADWWTVAGPLTMSALLLRVSGERLLDPRLSRRTGYADYKARTSGLLPRPPRRPRR